jgi:inner membrane protease ATP23
MPSWWFRPRERLMFTFSPPAQPPEDDQQKGENEENYGDPILALPPDDDTRWRADALPPGAPQPTQLATCEARLARAKRRERPRTLISAIVGNSCTALKDEKGCAKCRICPNEGKWQYISGYYNGQKGRVLICAEKEPSEEQIEATLTHELVHAYDHCRYSMRVPFVGRQAPWALTCPAAACSEVRAYLLGDFWTASATPAPPRLGGSDGLGGGWGAGPDPYASDGGMPAGGGGLASSGGPAEAAHAHRDALYRAALTSALMYGECAEHGAEQGTDSRANCSLQKVFNACLADHAPFDRTEITSGGFPPMPPEVDAAGK